MSAHILGSLGQPDEDDALPVGVNMKRRFARDASSNALPMAGDRDDIGVTTTPRPRWARGGVIGAGAADHWALGGSPAPGGSSAAGGGGGGSCIASCRK